MLRVYKSTATLSTVAAIALLLTGCGESKISQCNKVIKVANQAASLGQQYGKDSKTAKGSQGLTELATKIDQVGTEMKGLEIKDEKLQGFQGRFLKLYQDISKGLNDAATAINKKDIKSANRFFVNLQKSSVEEGLIVKEINGYCSGK
ncbi:hypothetical protein NOS3756_13340 [Nostoc sp. NIES-3756]|uniref:hypothetical protein n=1 Tax=Nostoc sp. NIES-3756 TaxID=1751286 RepID=UPI000721557A|nr:hypothetical protein [Nostoc sp. NIES-3756]BAT52394.1 hypothetical protein NOS3756_13340 [Nostoc sp. NIES-3756]BAY39913.1 hypothetical protein NIES2111_42900 [Nostoc sp. NIES-2111]